MKVRKIKTYCIQHDRTKMWIGEEIKKKRGKEEQHFKWVRQRQEASAMPNAEVAELVLKQKFPYLKDKDIVVHAITREVELGSEMDKFIGDLFETVGFADEFSDAAYRL